MLFSIELVSPKQTLIGVCLVVSMTIQALKHMRAWFSFLGFQLWWIEFGVCFAAPTEFLMMFGFVWTVAFDIFGTLYSAQKCSMTPLSAVFALWDARVHVGFPNGCDVVSNVETPID